MTNGMRYGADDDDRCCGTPRVSVRTTKVNDVIPTILAEQAIVDIINEQQD